MNNRRLSYGLLLAISTALVAGCDEPATPKLRPSPPRRRKRLRPRPRRPPRRSPCLPAPPPRRSHPSSPAKPAKEKWVGKFAQDFQGEVKDAFEADAAKKYAKEKDTKKKDEAAKKLIETLAQNTIENTADTHTFSVKASPSTRSSSRSPRTSRPPSRSSLGKDETAKKDLKGAEITITFIDDNTFSLKDPFAKDPKKAQTLVFKRQ